METKWRVSVAVLFASIAIVFGNFCYLFYPPKPSPSLIQWKNSGKNFTYKSHIIFYKDEEGSGQNGETLLILHGFPTSSFDYVKVFDEIKKSFSRVVILDFIGFGFSDKPVNYNYTILDQADLVESLLKDLAISQVHLFSHDMGDTVLQELIYRSNSKKLSFQPKTIAMANGGIIPEVLRLTLTQKLMLVPFLQPFVPYVVNYCVYSYGLSKVFGNETQPTQQEYKDFWLAEHHNHGEKVIAKRNLYQNERKVYGERWKEALKESSFHFIFGKRDPLVPENYTDILRSTFPKATIDVIDVGHFVFFEAPEETMKSYQAFLQKNI